MYFVLSQVLLGVTKHILLETLNYTLCLLFFSNGNLHTLVFENEVGKESPLFLKMAKNGHKCWLFFGKVFKRILKKTVRLRGCRLKKLGPRIFF